MIRRSCLVVAVTVAFVASSGLSQTIIIDTLETTLGDTNDIVWLQLSEDYDSTVATPLLFGWHGWGGDHTQMSTMTAFDEQANERNWLAASMRGPNIMHWNNPAAQSHCVDVLNWIAERYNFDHRRIYMLGGSMGGAAGMVFSNNHLDPSGWMAAATASGSGIMDCHRRYLEQGSNHSMYAAFGGTPVQVPFQYHRNSAIYFHDSTQSMHYNLRHLPMYYTFGLAETYWMQHALDMYAVMSHIADTLYMVEAFWPSHGWDSMSAREICDWLENFELNDNPDDISINADEDGRYYWVDVDQWDSTDAFTRFDATHNSAQNSIIFHGWWNLEWAMLDLDMMGIDVDSIVHIEWTVDDTLETLRLPGYDMIPEQVLRNGNPTSDWSYEAFWGIVSLFSDTGYSEWEIHPHSAFVPPNDPMLPIPAGDIIRAAWPNPFNPILRVNYHVEASGFVKVGVYDLLGRSTVTLSEGRHAAGDYRTAFDGRDFPSGIYFVCLESRTGTHSVKVVLLK